MIIGHNKILEHWLEGGNDVYFTVCTQCKRQWRMKQLSEKDRRLYIECDCTAKDHLVCVSTFEWRWNDNNVEHNLVIETQLSHFRGFFGRVWSALRYVFKRRICNFPGQWTSCLVDVTQAKELRDLLTEYIEDSESALGDEQQAKRKEP